jgi:hypothetical protein
MAQKPSNLQIIDNLPKVVAAIDYMTTQKVMVGIPDTAAGRNDGSPISNAVIGYVMETGEPGHNVPARPFLVPGVESIQKEIVADLLIAGRLALDGDKPAVQRKLQALGVKAQNAVRSKISSNIPPPLAESTVKARLRRTRKGTAMLKSLQQQTMNLVYWGKNNLTTLINTGQLRQSITFVIRSLPAQRWRHGNDGK